MKVAKSKKKKTGRPKKKILSSARKKIEKLRGKGRQQKQIGAEIGISDRTLRRRLKDDEKVLSAYKAGEDKRKTDCLNMLHECANMAKENPAYQKSLIWELEAEHGMRQRVELTTPPGQPLEVKRTSALEGRSDEELDALIAAAEKIAGKQEN